MSLVPSVFLVGGDAAARSGPPDVHSLRAATIPGCRSRRTTLSHATHIH
jgi:hypothetical protein